VEANNFMRELQMRLHNVLLGLGLFLASPVWAQPRTAEAGSNELIMTMYDQIQSLQQEVQTLRGVVEEQGFQLKRLQSDQRDRYLDIDRRLSGLTPVGPAGSGLPGSVQPGTVPPALVDTGGRVAPSSDQSVLPGVDPMSSGTASASGPAGGLDEQELYRTALNLLLEESKYNEAIAQFQLYLDSFPKGRLFTNALYWQGEAFLLVPANTQAVDVFQRLLNDFPQDPKAPGAMYKMGMAYRQLGDVARAGQIWRDLKTRYPESVNEIRLADEALRSL
jgi:tol-pal system protein YbgF